MPDTHVTAAQKSAPQPPKPDLAFRLSAFLIVFGLSVVALTLFTIVGTPVEESKDNAAFSRKALAYAWAPPRSLNLRGVGFRPDEPVNLYASPSLDLDFRRSVLLKLLKASTDGGIHVENLDLGSSVSYLNNGYLIAHGSFSDHVLSVGPLAVPPVPTLLMAQPTLAPTPQPPRPLPTATVLTAVLSMVEQAPPPNPDALNQWYESYWYESYFANRDFLGAPVYTRNSNSLYYYWGLGSPAPGVPGDNFSAVFTRTQSFPQLDSIVFELVVDGAAKVYLDGTLVIDEWYLGPKRKKVGSVPVTPGEHIIRVEFYDTTGSAALCLTWQNGFTAWAGRYYNTNDAQPPVVLIRDDRDIDFQWGENSPGPGVNADQFSATGEYEFTLAVDDLARVIIDGKVLKDLDTWNGPGPGTRTQRVRLRAGRHYIQVQFREFTGNAFIKLSWQLITVVPAVVP